MWLIWIGAANAWEHSGFVWFEEDLPVEIEWSGAPPGMTVEEVREALADARATWVDGTCAGFDISFVEVEEADDQGADAVVYESYGTPAVAVTSLLSETREIGGHAYQRAEGVDILLSPNVEWTTDARIESGDCTDAYSFRAAITHEIGHVAGLAHACDADDLACTESSAEATMNWEFLPCSTDWNTLTGDDVIGLQYLYGTAVVFECAPDPADAMAATCTLSAPEASALTSFSWDFGDGTTSSEREVHHAWAEPGAHEVTVCMELADCGIPTCTTTLVWAVAPGTVEGETPAQETSEPGGCRDGGSAWLLVGLGLLGRRRRRESPAVQA